MPRFVLAVFEDAMTLLIPDKPWAITEAAYRAVLDVINRDNLRADLAEARRAGHTEAVERFAGRPMDGARYITIRDGVAIIDAYGPIARRANLFSEISGGTSIDLLARDYQAAFDNPAVHSILTVFDSPGGEVGGVSELAAYLYGQRGAKPMTAYVDVMACSAAYWLAAAHDQIVTNDTAITGSIGVVMTIPDPTAAKAKDLSIVSSQSPNKRPDPTTEAGRTELQTLVDTTADVFIQAVAAMRGVTPETVVAEFGAGGVRVGAQAVTAGLADRVGDFESTLQSLITSQSTMRRPGMSTPRQGGSMSTNAHEAAAPQDAAVPDQRVVEEMQAKLERLTRANLAMQTKVITTEATAFADRTIAANLGVPAHRQTLIAAHTAFARADAGLAFEPVAVGTQTCASLAGVLEAVVGQRQPHSLTTEQVKGDIYALPSQPGAEKPDPNAPMTPERRAELLSKTPEGRAVLAQEAAAVRLANKEV